MAECKINPFAAKFVPFLEQAANNPYSSSGDDLPIVGEDKEVLVFKKLTSWIKGSRLQPKM
jgi:hypothetical protein